MPSTSYPKPHTDLRTCKWCRTRVIFSRTPENKKMPPLNYGTDPTGTIAARHDPTAGWVARFLAKNEQPAPGEQRYAQHACEGTQRHQHRRGRAPNQRPQGSKRRRPAQPTLDLGTQT